MLFNSKIIYLLIVSFCILSISCNQEGKQSKETVINDTKVKEKIKTVKNVVTNKSDKFYQEELLKLRTKTDTSITPVLVDTLSDNRFLLTFDISESKRLDKHIYFYNSTEDNIHEGFTNWINDGYLDLRYNKDLRLIKFYFLNTINDSTLNYFMDMVMIPQYSIFDKSGTIVKSRKTETQ